MIDHYDWPGGREAMLRFGPASGPIVVAVLPLFEEANRTRAMTVALLRALAERGIASVLPDLPGTGESLVETGDATIGAMREAFDALATNLQRESRPVYCAGIRSGALLDTLAAVAGRWHLAPIDGREVLRDLTRVRRAALAGRQPVDPDLGEGTVTIAGNMISGDMLAELKIAAPFLAEQGVSLRTVRLETDSGPADRKIAGVPLWRRSGPDNDLNLAALLADDIAGWISR